MTKGMTSRILLTSPIHWPKRTAKNRGCLWPQFFVFTDCERLPDPSFLFKRLPRGAAIILRHTDPKQRARLAHNMTPKAQRCGLNVLISEDIRLALKINADGVHLSEGQAKRGPLRHSSKKPGFIITAAAHSHLALWQANKAGAHFMMLSPIFSTASHTMAKPLGLWRAIRLSNTQRHKVIALGGISMQNKNRFKNSSFQGFGAIGAWLDSQSSTQT